MTTTPIIDSSKTDYSIHIDIESGFCGDRSISKGTGTGTTETYYAVFSRLYGKSKPTLRCLNSNDLYKTKIGLITADEVAYAGGKHSVSNYSYYLYTGNWYWTISPYQFNNTTATVFRVYLNGSLNNYYVDNSNGGVRPVINLSSENLSISGSGTINDPYVIS